MENIVHDEKAEKVILPQQELGASCFITSISGSSSGMCESVFPVYSFTPFTKIFLRYLGIQT
jgi:hypothetical protein